MLAFHGIDLQTYHIFIKLDALVGIVGLGHAIPVVFDGCPLSTAGEFRITFRAVFHRHPCKYRLCHLEVVDVKFCIIVKLICLSGQCPDGAVVINFKHT